MEEQDRRSRDDIADEAAVADALLAPRTRIYSAALVIDKLNA